MSLYDQIKGHSNHSKSNEETGKLWYRQLENTWSEICCMQFLKMSVYGEINTDWPSVYDWEFTQWYCSIKVNSLSLSKSYIIKWGFMWQMLASCYCKQSALFHTNHKEHKQ